jgi:hypothetical protein
MMENLTLHSAINASVNNNYRQSAYLLMNKNFLKRTVSKLCLPCNAFCGTSMESQK